MFGMTPDDFYDITSQHIAGPNKDPQKAELIRTFVIPDRFIIPGSSTNCPRIIKIFAAFISAEWVYVMSDFSGLVRMHLRSKKSLWTEGDLHPGSDVNFLYALHQFFIYLIYHSAGMNCLEPSKVGQIGCLSPPLQSQQFNDGNKTFLRNIVDGQSR